MKRSVPYIYCILVLASPLLGVEIRSQGSADTVNTPGLNIDSRLYYTLALHELVFPSRFHL